MIDTKHHSWRTYTIDRQRMYDFLNLLGVDDPAEVTEVEIRATGYEQVMVRISRMMIDVHGQAWSAVAEWPVTMESPLADD
jgi:hypothetical protein